MDEPSFDIRDHRGRLIRLAIAVAIGLVITVIVLHAIEAVAETPNPDPIAGSSVGLLAIGLFVASSAAALIVVGAVARRIK